MLGAFGGIGINAPIDSGAGAPEPLARTLVALRAVLSRIFLVRVDVNWVLLPCGTAGLRCATQEKQDRRRGGAPMGRRQTDHVSLVPLFLSITHGTAAA